MKFLTRYFKRKETTPKTSRRKHHRVASGQLANWDFFTSPTRSKTGRIENISAGGCLLVSSEPIQNQRWLRLIFKTDSIHNNIIGRVVRLEGFSSESGSSYFYGIEFLNRFIGDRELKNEQQRVSTESEARTHRKPLALLS